MRRLSAADADDAIEREQLFLGIGLDGGHAGERIIQMAGAQRDCPGKTGDLPGRLRAGAKPALRPAAEEERLRRAHAAADVKPADPLGRADLVPADRDQVGAERISAEGKLQKALHCVGVQQRAGTLRLQKPRDLANGEEAACFVVHEHHRDERGILAQRVLDLRDGDIAVFVGLQVCDGIALLLQRFAGVQHRTMFHGGGDDVLPHAPVLMRGKADRPVIALRAAGGEDEFLRFAAKRVCNRPARGVHRGLCLPASGVLRAGVAPAGGQRIVNSARYFCGNGRGGGVVEIDHIGKIPFFGLVRRPK